MFSGNLGTVLTVSSLDVKHRPEGAIAGDAAGVGNATSGSVTDQLTRQHRMTLDEAQLILNVKKDADLEAVLKVRTLSISQDYPSQFSIRATSICSKPTRPNPKPRQTSPCRRLLQKRRQRSRSTRITSNPKSCAQENDGRPSSRPAMAPHQRRRRQQLPLLHLLPRHPHQVQQRPHQAKISPSHSRGFLLLCIILSYYTVNSTTPLHTDTFRKVQ